MSPACSGGFRRQTADARHSDSASDDIDVKPLQGEEGEERRDEHGNKVTRVLQHGGP